MGGTEPANIHAEKGTVIDACQILAGMEIAIKADSFVEVDEYCERQQYFEAIETVKNVSEDGKCSYIETENSLFCNIEGISSTISQELQRMGHEFHTPSFEVDEREI